MKHTIIAVSAAAIAISGVSSQTATPDYPSHFTLFNRKYTTLTVGSQGLKIKAIPVLNADKIIVAQQGCINCGSGAYQYNQTQSTTAIPGDPIITDLVVMSNFGWDIKFNGTQVQDSICQPADGTFAVSNCFSNRNGTQERAKFFVVNGSQYPAFQEAEAYFGLTASQTDIYDSYSDFVLARANITATNTSTVLIKNAGAQVDITIGTPNPFNTSDSEDFKMIYSDKNAVLWGAYLLGLSVNNQSLSMGKLSLVTYEPASNLTVVAVKGLDKFNAVVAEVTKTLQTLNNTVNVTSEGQGNVSKFHFDQACSTVSTSNILYFTLDFGKILKNATLRLNVNAYNVSQCDVSLIIIRDELLPISLQKTDTLIYLQGDAFDNTAIHFDYGQQKITFDSNYVVKQNPEPAPQPEDQQGGGDGNRQVWLIVGISVAAVIILVIGFIIYRRKKVSQNLNEYEELGHSKN